MAKQFALQEGFRNCGAIYANKGLASPGAVFMNEFRHKLFPRSRLTGDQHRAAGIGGFLQVFPDLHHGVAGRDHLAGTFAGKLAC